MSTGIGTRQKRRGTAKAKSAGNVRRGSVETREAVLFVRMTVEEKASCSEMAKTSNLTDGAWARSVLVRASRPELSTTHHPNLSDTLRPRSGGTDGGRVGGLLYNGQVESAVPVDGDPSARHRSLTDDESTATIGSYGAQPRGEVDTEF